MRPITWLHISDFHLVDGKAWSQDAVLRAMVDDVRRRTTGGLTLDLILVTGDLAFSGKEPEYTLVESFIDDLISSVGLTRARVFCVPGNHDVDRARQTTCFAGARLLLRNESEIYSFLSNQEERATLMARLDNYRQFDERYFESQLREVTNDGLAYTTTIAIDEVDVTIVGLNSAWLSAGGSSDDGKLLLGENQVVQALEAATRTREALNKSDCLR